MSQETENAPILVVIIDLTHPQSTFRSKKPAALKQLGALMFYRTRGNGRIHGSEMSEHEQATILGTLMMEYKKCDDELKLLEERACSLSADLKDAAALLDRCNRKWSSPGFNNARLIDRFKSLPSTHEIIEFIEQIRGTNERFQDLKARRDTFGV